MKHKSLLTWSAVGLCLLTLAGCSSHQQSAPKATHHTEKAATVYYQNLGQADKNKVKFEFSLSQDETKNSTDPVYMVSMKIKNNSSKVIKFHKDKFVYVLPKDKVLSSNHDTLTVQPGKTESVDQLFDNVPEDGTRGDGIIEYLNSANKLAYAKFENNIATSDNLNNKKLSQKNENTTGNSENASSRSTSDSSSNSSSSSSVVAASSSSASTQSSMSSESSAPQSDSIKIHNRSEAIAAAKAAYGSDTYEGRQLSWFTMGSSNGNYIWVKASDGTTMSGSTLSFYVFPNGAVERKY